MPMSDDAPVTNTESLFIYARANRRLRDRLSILVDDPRLQFQPVKGFVQKVNLSTNREPIPDIRGRLQFHIDAMQERVFSREMHPDQTGIERGRQHPKHDTAGEAASGCKRRVN